MQRSIWWHIAVVAMCAALTIAAIGQPAGVFAGVAGAAAALLITWVLIGRHAPDSARAGLVFLGLTIVIAAIGTAVLPMFAIVQFLGYPFAWTLPRTLRGAIGANIWLAGAIGAGMLIGIGTEPADLLQIAGTVAFSLSFSLLFGMWFARTIQLSDERQGLIEQLTRSQEEVVALNRAAAQLHERERLARELHDTLAQDLTGLVMLSERARRTADAATRERLLEQLESGARSALAETRALVAANAPASLEGGLDAALTRFAERFGRDTGVDVSVQANSAPSLTPELQVVALRCAQEALANVRKHAGATRVSVSMIGHRLTVSDDGSGFDVTAPAAGFGLSGMRERLALVGGRLDVRSDAAGTTLAITLPDSGASEPQPNGRGVAAAAPAARAAETGIAETGTADASTVERGTVLETGIADSTAQGAAEASQSPRSESERMS